MKLHLIQKLSVLSVNDHQHHRNPQSGNCLKCGLEAKISEALADQPAGTRKRSVLEHLQDQLMLQQEQGITKMMSKVRFLQS